MRLNHALACASILLLAACAQQPERAGIPTQWRPSPNFDERRPDFVIIHGTGDDTVRQALKTLTDRKRDVSAHYLIARDGTIYQLVDERDRAWHAGKSQWGSDTDLNSSSLGIELDNNGHEPFPDAQISALIALLRDIERRYHIPAANFIGHSDIAPGRKVDPSRYFPWKTLAANGFGLWCDEPLLTPPEEFDPVFALAALGYDVSDVPAAISAFKLHFIQDDTSPALTDHDMSVLYCILLKKAAGLQ